MYFTGFNGDNLREMKEKRKRKEAGKKGRRKERQETRIKQDTWISEVVRKSISYIHQRSFLVPIFDEW